MRRSLSAMAALVVLAVLIVVTVRAASSTDASALGNARPAGPLPSGTVHLITEQVPCQLPGVATSKPAVATIQASGSCSGTFDGGLVCAADDGVLDGSLQVRLASGLRLTLTAVIPDYAGAGKYTDVALYAQVNRPGLAERWSVRDTKASLDAHGVLTMQAVLLPEPASGTRGALNLDGALSCPL